MISCNNGCSGGLSDTALDWLASQDNAGIILNDARPLTSPFTGVSGACNVNLSDAVDNKVTVSSLFCIMFSSSSGVTCHTRFQVNGYISVPYDEGSMAAIVAG